MFSPKRGLLIAAIFGSLTFIYVLYKALPGSLLDGPISFIRPQFHTNGTSHLTPSTISLLSPLIPSTRSDNVLNLLDYPDGAVAVTNYSRIVIIPRVLTDNISWIEELIPDENVVLYTADDEHSTRHPPMNKGNEVMVYLSYIIDNYHELPDIIIFMHAHRFAWHNNDLLGFDAAEMIRRLSNARVIRLGYVNMRCTWVPGCPEWIHPHSQKELIGKQEQAWLARSWHELFPTDDLPMVLSQPCCAQFAVSRGRVLSIPIDKFIFYRDWLIDTAYSNYVSGRIWEFVWQYIFTGRDIYCPVEHKCYCDGFGVCFGGENQYENFLELRTQKSNYELELMDLQLKIIESSEMNGYNATLGSVETGREIYLQDRIDALAQEIDNYKQKALERGRLSQNRAEESD